MNYIYYNEFGKEVKKYLAPIAKGSSGIKVYIFSDFDNNSETEYEVSASFQKADGFIAGDIFIPLSADTKINPYNQQAMYYRELTIGNDVTDIVGGLQLSIRYITTNVIEVDPDAIPPVTYEEKVINVTGMVTFNIYDATSFISPPQNTALINLKNYLLDYIDTQDANIFEVDRTFLQSLGVTNNLTVGNTLEVGDSATFNQDVTVGVDLTVYGRIFAEGGLDSRAKKIINVAPPENPLDAVNKSYVDTILITKENLTNKITAWGEAPTNKQYPSAKLVKDYLDNNIFTKTEINAMLSATYKPKGTITGTELLAITPTSDNEGFVYNISTEFTTTINFIEGAGITHRAGENVVIVENEENIYKFDVLSAFVDLGSYALKTDILALGTTSNDAYRGDLGQIAYNHSQSAHAPSNAQKNSDITKAEIEAKLTGEITTHSHALPDHIPLSKIGTGSSYTDILIGTPDGSIGTLSQSTFAPATHNHTKSQITDFPTIPSKTSDLTNDSGFATETYVNNKVSSVYKPQGSLAFNDLVVGLLKESNNGFVYNITEAFTTNENFVEGAGKSHSAGTNVVIVYNSSSYKFDVLGGTVDLTPYELQDNKVSSWSEIPDNTKYTGEKLVKDSLNELENTIQGVSDLSPFHYEGTFIGGDVSQNDFDNLIVGFEDLREGTNFNETKLQGSYFVCSADSSFYFNTPYHWSAAEGTGKTSAITYTWAAPYDLNGLTEINMKAGDIISILEFSYDTVSNNISTLIKVEKNPEETFVVKNESITPATKAKITYDAKGLVTAGADLIADDIPALPQSKITDLETDLGNKQATLTFDSSPTSGSTNPVTSGGVFDALAEKLNANKNAVATVGGLVTPSVAPTVVEIVGIDATGAQVRIQVDTNDFEIDGSTSPYTLKKKEVLVGYTMLYTQAFTEHEHWTGAHFVINTDIYDVDASVPNLTKNSNIVRYASETEPYTIENVSLITDITGYVILKEGTANINGNPMIINQLYYNPTNIELFSNCTLQFDVYYD